MLNDESRVSDRRVEATKWREGERENCETEKVKERGGNGGRGEEVAEET